jgi:stage II sporulation protein AA (anti-sigma F factor antagonist)
VDDATEALRIEVSRPFDEVVLIVLTGDIDLVSAVDLERRMEIVATEPAVLVVIDLAGLTFIDSSGLNALVRSSRLVESNGSVAVLAAPTLATRRVFEITRLAEVVPIEQTREEALARRFLTAAPPGQSDEPL